MIRIFKYVVYDLLHSRFMQGYTLALFAITLGLFQLEADSGKAILSLINIILFFIPLVCLIFSTIYYYNSLEFTELLLVQPITRKSIIGGQLAGVGAAFSLSFFMGVGFPVALFAANAVGFTLVVAGWLMTLVFVALAFFISVLRRDKAQGIGFGLLVWFYFALLYDAILLFLLFAFNDYPIEKWVLPLASLNPVDLARIMILLQLDLAALMGYSGAVYKEFFGSALGFFYTLGCISVWIIVPAWLTIQKFNRKDF